MKRTGALIWKEWRQQRWFAIVGLIVFLGFPLADAVHMKLSRGEFVMYGVAAEISLWAGGFFAILAAVYVTCGDLKNGSLVFWRSRPVGLWRWLAVKYVLALAMVMVVVSAALVVQATVNKEWTTQPPYPRSTSAINVLSCHSWTVVLLFSIAFCCGVLVRKAVYATMLAVAAALIIYFGPVLAPPLERLSVLGLMRQWPLLIVHPSTLGHGGPWFADRLRLLAVPGAADLAARINIDVVGYAITAIAVATVMAFVSGWAVKNNRRIRVGRKLMFWMVAMVALMLLSVVAFKLGSNLKCLRIVRLFPGTKRRPYVVAATSVGDRGLLLQQQYNHHEEAGTYTYSLQRFDLSADQQVVGSCMELDADWTPSFLYRRPDTAMIWADRSAEMLYIAHATYEKTEPDEPSRVKSMELLTLALGRDGGAELLDRIDLLELAQSDKANSARLHLAGDRLYCCISGASILAVFDVSGEGIPRLQEKAAGPFGVRSAGGGRGADGRIYIRKTMRLIPAPGLSDEERLEMTVMLACYGVSDCRDGTFVEISRDFMRVFKLDSVDGDLATLVMTANRNSSQLERLVEMYPSQVLLRQGFAYVLYRYGGAGMTVFDLRRAGDIRRVGHYSAPTERFSVMRPLADGTFLLAGKDLHIVEPARVR